MPAWSGDTVEEFHLHLRRWDMDRLEEPDLEETDAGEGVPMSDTSLAKRRKRRPKKKKQAPAGMDASSAQVSVVASVMCSKNIEEVKHVEEISSINRAGPVGLDADKGCDEGDECDDRGTFVPLGPPAQSQSVEWLISTGILKRMPA